MVKFPRPPGHVVLSLSSSSLWTASMATGALAFAACAILTSLCLPPVMLLSRACGSEQILLALAGAILAPLPIPRGALENLSSLAYSLLPAWTAPPPSGDALLIPYCALCLLCTAVPAALSLAVLSLSLPLSERLELMAGRTGEAIKRDARPSMAMAEFDAISRSCPAATPARPPASI